LRSEDGGKTWSKPIDVEPADGVEASYAVPLKTPSGRIYLFYNHNTDNIRKIKGDENAFKDGYCRRVDSLGYFVFKYSDDHGKTWSDQHYNIPVREFEIDRENVYGGEIRFFWNVGKAFSYDGVGYVPLHKVGRIGVGFFVRSEGCLLKSPNILTEEDPEKIEWETLPDGDVGLRAPEGGGLVAEEQSFTYLSDGSFYVIYRTIDGHPACAYSRDRGHTWTEPRYEQYADGRLIKNPRAANFAWRCSNGKFLYWHHNHGLKWYDERNPVWLSGGVEIDTPDGKQIAWSQPEIVIYTDDTYIRMSYPDMVETEEGIFLTETQKRIARVHEVKPKLLQAMWNQHETATVAEEGLILSLPDGGSSMPAEVAAPRMPHFTKRSVGNEAYGQDSLRQGFTLDLWFTLEDLEPGQVLVDKRREDGRGFCLRTSLRGTIEIVLSDDMTKSVWDTDPGMIEAGKRHHLGVVVDGGPNVISFITDGKFNDGGDFRPFGWGRFSPNLRRVDGASKLLIAPSLRGSVESLRIYNRYLLTSEVIGNWRAGQE
jgi:hypothetical protein